MIDKGPRVRVSENNVQQGCWPGKAKASDAHTQRIVPIGCILWCIWDHENCESTM